MNLAVLGGVLALFAFGAARWRAAVMIVPVAAVFEGAFRKWLLPELGQWIYFAKDFLLLGAYAGFFAPRAIQHRTLLAPHPANGLLAFLAAVAVVELANPSLPNLAVGLLGIKAYLVYVPLMYLVPAVFRDPAAVRRYWTRFLLLSLVPLLLGIVQFGSPADSVLNRYAWEDELPRGVSTFGSLEKARITGTFAYISGYTAYLTLIFLMAVSWVIFEGRRRAPWWLYGVLALTLGNLLMTGSRGPFLVLGASAAVMLGLASRAGERQVRRTVLTMGVALPLIAILVSNLFPQAHAAFVERAEGTQDLPERLIGIVSNPVWAFGEAGLAGYGIGSTHQARAFLIPSETSHASPPEAEGEWERIILEIGPFGFLLVLSTRVLVANRLWRTFLLFQGTEFLPFLATALVFSLASIPANLVFNHTAAVFYWFLAGFGLLAREWEPRRVQAAARPGVAYRGHAS